MKKVKQLNEKRYRRKIRTRSKIFGTKEKPRLSVFRSNRYLYAQLIDDEKGHTLATVSSKELGKKTGSKTDEALEIGKLLAELSKKIGIKSAVFDTGRYKYHGRIKALAESARQAGLKI